MFKVAIAISLGGHAAITLSLISGRELWEEAHLLLRTRSVEGSQFPAAGIDYHTSSSILKSYHMAAILDPSPVLIIYADL